MSFYCGVILFSRFFSILYTGPLSGINPLSTCPLSLIHNLQMFFSILWVVFTFLMLFCETHSFRLWWSPICLFFGLLLLMLSVPYVRNHSLIQDHEDLLLCCPLIFYRFSSYLFKSHDPFWVNFLCMVWHKRPNSFL